MEPWETSQTIGHVAKHESFMSTFWNVRAMKVVQKGVLVNGIENCGQIVQYQPEGTLLSHSCCRS